VTLDGKGESLPALNYGPRAEGLWGLEVNCTEQVNDMVTIKKDFERRASEQLWHISENVFSFADDICSPPEV